MDEAMALGTIWESAKTLLDFRYMLSLFFVCLYLYKFSPWGGLFEGKKKEFTLLFGLVLGAIFVTVKFFELGLTKELWSYHLHLLISFCVTTSLYENLASYLIRKLDQVR